MKPPDIFQSLHTIYLMKKDHELRRKLFIFTNKKAELFCLSYHHMNRDGILYIISIKTFDKTLSGWYTNSPLKPNQNSIYYRDTPLIIKRFNNGKMELMKEFEFKKEWGPLTRQHKRLARKTFEKEFEEITGVPFNELIFNVDEWIIENI